MPFAKIKSGLDKANPTAVSFLSTQPVKPPVNSQLGMSTTNTFSPKKKLMDGDTNSLAYQFKRTSEVGNVPFAASKRFISDEAKDRNACFSKSQFTWKAPTVMHI